MRHRFGFLCVCALGMVPLVGCSDPGGPDGNGGTGGMPECQSPEDCDDDNECTDDTCTDGMCSNTAVADNTECDFGGLPGLCMSGVCEDAMLCEGVDCDDGNECTEDVCDPMDGACHPVEDGTLCAEGLCIEGECGPIGSVFPCTEQGIRAAIATGGGPYTFSCGGPTVVKTNAEIVIDNDVILDGEGNLTVNGDGDGDDDHRIFSVPEDVTAELHGFTVTRGGGAKSPPLDQGGGIYNAGTLSIGDSTVSDNLVFGWQHPVAPPGCVRGLGGGVYNGGTLTVEGCTISSNSAHSSGCSEGLVPGDGGGIYNAATGIATISNSTLSGNAADHSGGGIRNEGTLTLTNSTVSGNTAANGSGIDNQGTASLTNTLFDGDCQIDITSNGYNIESPGDTCGFDQGTDKFDVSVDDLKLGELADNGGPTVTHALGAGSVAIDVIPEADCEVDTDQRGEPRPETGGTMCDVGAFEVQP